MIQGYGLVAGRYRRYSLDIQFTGGAVCHRAGCRNRIGSRHSRWPEHNRSNIPPRNICTRDTDRTRKTTCRVIQGYGLAAGVYRRYSLDIQFTGGAVCHRTACRNVIGPRYGGWAEHNRSNIPHRNICTRDPYLIFEVIGCVIQGNILLTGINRCYPGNVQRTGVGNGIACRDCIGSRYGRLSKINSVYNRDCNISSCDTDRTRKITCRVIQGYGLATGRYCRYSCDQERSIVCHRTTCRDIIGS